MNVVISKSAWHYRLMKLAFKEEIPDNLCGYFWQLTLGLPVIGLLFAILCIFLSPLFLCAWIGDHLPESLKRKREFKGPIFSYIRARKLKICPLIEFKE